MKKSYFWFLLEGLICGVLQVLSVEYYLSAWHGKFPWADYAVPIAGVVLSSIGFFFLMRRFPGKKPAKFGFGLMACLSAVPAWFIYRIILGVPARTLQEGEGTRLIQLIAAYTVAVLAIRTVIAVAFLIRRKLKKL